MKRVAAVLAVLAPLGLLSGCSASVTAVGAIGYDAQGRLVGAVKVCDGHFFEAHLAPATPDDAPDIGAWRRNSPFKGTESWPLRGSGTGPWKVVGPALPELGSGTGYVFWAESKNENNRSDFLLFHGSDLAKLAPGEVLVRRNGPTDSGGETTMRVAAIPLDQLTRENCTG